ncbi:hypothetical protein PhCBS80983_g02883 [Powellomyces hirtus]|uniref:Protein YOP1 n=1 Tax=Powellomyces hirtus TaxID=109895 RepID=A0A507E4P8_9FUNG|nr:hypothetical protein PhCBS80983_g02883 [Powellomyces hirtus]
MALFTVLEIPSDILLFWLPFYYEVKTLIILWLVVPYTHGSRYLYSTLLHPLLDQHESEIDTAMGKAQLAATQLIFQSGQKAFLMLRNAVAQSLLSGQFAFMSQQQPQPQQPHSSRSSSTPKPSRRRSSRIVELDSDHNSSHSDSDSNHHSTDSSYKPPRSLKIKHAKQLQPQRKRIVASTTTTTRRRSRQASLVKVKNLRNSEVGESRESSSAGEGASSEGGARRGRPKRGE